MKPDACHLAGLELASALFSENANQRVYSESLSEALSLARAASERQSRQEAPLDYAKPSVSASRLVVDPAAPKDYVAPVSSFTLPTEAVPLRAKLFAAGISGVLFANAITDVFKNDLSSSDIIFGWVSASFWFCMCTYMSVRAGIEMVGILKSKRSEKVVKK